MKKSLTWLVAIVVIVSMAMFVGIGCQTTTAGETTAAGTTAAVTTAAGETTAAETTGVVAEKRYKIAFIVHDAGTPFFAPTIAGINDAAALFGVDVSYMGPKTMDVAGQVDMITSALGSGIDGLVTTLPDPAAYDTVLQEAMKNGIPVIGTNTDNGNLLDRLVFVGQDQPKAGFSMGEQIKKIMPDGGKIILWTCCPGHTAIEARLQGARDSLEGSNITVVDTLTYGAEMADVVSKVEAAYLANPDVKGFFSGDAFTEGIGRYISTNNLQGKLLGGGFDLVDATLGFIKDGSLQFTIGQDPYSQGFYPVMMLWLYFTKGIPPKDIDTGADMVTPENIDAILAREAKMAGK